MDLRSFQNVTTAWQKSGQVDGPLQLQDFQAKPRSKVQIDDKSAGILQQVLDLAKQAGVVSIPGGVPTGDLATVISGWLPYLNAPPTNLGWPTAPGDIFNWVTTLLQTQPGAAIPKLQDVVDAARRYIDAFGAIPYMPWDKIPWQWLKDGGAIKIADAFKNTPGAIPDAFKLLTQIALIPANVPWQSGSKTSDALHSIGEGVYAPPNILTIDWNAEPYKSIVEWFKKAGTAVTSGGDYWPLIYWIVTTPEALAHVDHLPLMYQDLKCYTDPAYGNGVQNFKDQIVKDNYEKGWCTKGKTEPSCLADGQSCDQTHPCCEGSECKEGKCEKSSSNVGWYVLGGLGLLAGIAAVGFAMSGKAAQANPCGCPNPSRKTDIDISSAGGAGIFYITPLTSKGSKWVKKHVMYESWQKQGDSIVVDDTGYTMRIAEAAKEDGLTVSL